MAIDILHDEEDGRTVLTDVVQCADIRMRDACDDASFVAEPFDPGTWRAHQLARQDFEGDRQDLEGAKTGAGGESHRMADRRQYSDLSNAQLNGIHVHNEGNDDNPAAFEAFLV